MIDRVEIVVKGGDGGYGVVSFRREKFVPRGGPDGGNGGHGGDVILLADRSVRTLKEIGRRRIYRADKGGHGKGSNKQGAAGGDLVIRVPVGTQVSRLSAGGASGEAGDLTVAGQTIVVARGGMGGWGNARFATSTNRAPRIAQSGQRGEEVKLLLDLKLLADVGLVGLPNVGKSTLLRAISAARPKVADYPFTTLEPVLGVVEHGWQRFVVADIPGLIEGAHEGAGLGLEFLRHIERTRAIVHLVDGSSPDPRRDVQTVNEELEEYGRGLLDREQILAVNKIDIPEVSERRGELAELLGHDPGGLFFISAVSGEGVLELVHRMAKAVGAAQEQADAAPAAIPVLRPQSAAPVVRVQREDGAFRVEGLRVVAFAEMMPVEDEEGRAELWRRFGRWGVTSALRRAGARPGDRIRMGSVEIEWLS